MKSWSKQVITLPPLHEGEPTRSITLRPLWAIETDAIDEAYPRPVPPMVKNPAAGSLAPKVADEADPTHQRELRKWLKWVKRAQVSVSMQATEEWTGDKVKALAERAAKSFTNDEIELLWVRLRELSTGEMIRNAMTIIISPSADGGESDKGDSVQVPEAYAITEDGLMMRAAERFGQNPATWPKTLSPEERALTLANELVRRKEENERMDAIRAALGMMGV